MRTNTDITLYNRYVSAGAEVYQRTQIKNVAWQGGQGTAGAGATSQEANQSVVYIPMLRTGYMAPKAWALLSSKSANWTLQTGDIIVKGLVSDNVASNNATGTITASALKAKYDNVLVIDNVVTRDYGSLAMQHWEVTIK